MGKKQKRSHQAKTYSTEMDSTCIASLQYRQGVLTVEYNNRDGSNPVYEYDATLADYRAVVKGSGEELNQRILGR